MGSYSWSICSILEINCCWIYSFTSWCCQIIWQKGLRIFLSYEIELIFLIYILYFYKSILFLTEEEQLTEYRKGTLQLLFVNYNIKFKNKYLLILNPFHFYHPLLGLETKSKNRKTNKQVAKDNRLLIALLKKFIPVTSLLWVVTLLLLPFSLLYLHTGLIIISVILLYTGLIILIIQIWLIRRKLNIPSSKFIEIIFEYILCPPFSINAIRSISLIILENKGYIK